MDIVKDLLLNYYFLSVLIAWVLSIIIKSILAALRKNTGLSITDGLQNGGMPSSHSAVVASITTAVLIIEGFSSLFFITIIFSLIIISDAFRLRQNVGIQGEQLNLLLKKSKEKTINVVYGHTLAQVIVGIILGIATAILMFYII